MGTIRAKVKQTEDSISFRWHNERLTLYRFDRDGVVVHTRMVDKENLTGIEKNQIRFGVVDLNYFVTMPYASAMMFGLAELLGYSVTKKDENDPPSCI